MLYERPKSIFGVDEVDDVANFDFAFEPLICYMVLPGNTDHALCAAAKHGSKALVSVHICDAWVIAGYNNCIAYVSG